MTKEEALGFIARLALPDLIAEEEVGLGRKITGFRELGPLYWNGYQVYSTISTERCAESKVDRVNDSVSELPDRPKLSQLLTTKQRKGKKR